MPSDSRGKATIVQDGGGHIGKIAREAPKRVVRIIVKKVTEKDPIREAIKTAKGIEKKLSVKIMGKNLPGPGRRQKMGC